MTEPIVVSYSELDAYRQCPLKHHLAYKLRYSKPAQEGGALSRGSLYHEVLELHYKILKVHGQNPRALKTARGEVSKLLSDPVTGKRTDQQELVWWMYQGYVEVYGADRAWEILEIEKPFEVLMVEASDRHPQIQFKGKIDLLVRERRTGKLLVVDHKSGAELPTAKVIELDDQFGLYLKVAQLLGWDVDYAVHSAARTRMLKGDETGENPTPLEKRFLRTPSSRLPVELDNLWLDAQRAAVSAYTQQDAPYSSPDPDRCRWRCDFFEAHMLMRKGVKPSTALSSFGLKQDFTRH